MIIDSVSNLKKYVSIHKAINDVIDWLNNSDIDSLPYGRHTIDGDLVYVNCDWAQARTKDVPLEVHEKYIDIQIPLSGDEVMGYSPSETLGENVQAYNSEKDAAFYSAPADNYFLVKKGMFVIFLPGEGHAPAITEKGIRKLVFKLRIL